jgi:peptidoglycan/xylan/chitin deacetylase (PgdA/CDA1 family)
MRPATEGASGQGPPYDYSPIVSRPPLEWPGGAKVAFYVGLNMERFAIDRPGTTIAPVTADVVPDPLNYGWRDYGMRVGIWRTIQLLDRLGVPCTAIIDAAAARHYPEVVDAGRDRNWTWVAHGRDTVLLPYAVDDRESERRYLQEMVATLEAVLPQRPRGWLGPVLTETFDTPELLRELGFDYVLDWCCDDRPFPLRIPGLISVPYSVEVNDIVLFLQRGLTGEQFVALVLDQLDALLADGDGRVMALALHPFVVGQPFRHKHLARLLEVVAGTPGVWLTTTDRIADHFIGESAST